MKFSNTHNRADALLCRLFFFNCMTRTIGDSYTSVLIGQHSYTITMFKLIYNIQAFQKTGFFFKILIFKFFLLLSILCWTIFIFMMISKGSSLAAPGNAPLGDSPLLLRRILRRFVLFINNLVV